MKVSIIKPDSLIYEGSAKLIQLPGVDGSFEILQNHAPIVSPLKEGIIRLVNEEGKTFNFKINSGIVEMTNNTINILVQ